MADAPEHLSEKIGLSEELLNDVAEAFAKEKPEELVGLQDALLKWAGPQGYAELRTAFLAHAVASVVIAPPVADLRKESGPIAAAVAKVDKIMPGLPVTVVAGLLVLAVERACPAPQAPTVVNNITNNITVVVPTPGLSSLARVVLEEFRRAGMPTISIHALAASTSLQRADVELALKELVAAGLVVELAPAPGFFGLR
jgi:hypothetical protein